MGNARFFLSSTVCTYVGVYAYVCVHILYICIYICMYVCVYIYIITYMYSYISHRATSDFAIYSPTLSLCVSSRSLSLSLALPLSVQTGSGQRVIASYLPLVSREWRNGVQL